MSFSSVSSVTTLRRLWALDRFAQSAQVCVAMLGVLVLCVVQGHISGLVAPFLGIIAAALAESDGDWRGRVTSLVPTLLSFLIACVSVEILFDHPVLFAIGLTLATFVLTMLGALGHRCALTCTATLILAIYTMISLEQSGTEQGSFWHEPLWLVGGAAWYGAVSIIWHAFFSHHPVKLRAVRTLALLGDYLVLKSSLFEPVRGNDIEAKRVELANHNARVVGALNDLKEALFGRLMRHRGNARLERYLHLYFIMQEIHERATSSHYPYAELTEALFHSDVLFRAQLLLARQGYACQRLGQSLLLRQPFDHRQSQHALEDLNGAINALLKSATPEQRQLLYSLHGLQRNLSALEAQLILAENPERLDNRTDVSLFDRSPHGIREVWERIRMQLTVQSPLFRHACRLTLVMLMGYLLLKWIHPTQGYWILLTGLFVCRPGYGATLSILRQRILGTVAGLVLGWALLNLFAAPLEQALFALVAGVIFFACRVGRYTLATAAITLMVLCCFNLLGNGFALIVPRLIDTLLGAALAGLAVILVLPDWQGKRLAPQAAKTISCAARYLQAILQQFEHGREDTLAYRLARRDAHNADAAFASLVSTLLQTPKRHHAPIESALRFITLSHSLLGYLSALGAHRDTIHLDSNDPLYYQAQLLLDQLNTLASSHSNGEIPASPLSVDTGNGDDDHRLVESQLRLINNLLKPMQESLRQLG